MAGGLTVSVRQIASYPALTPTTLTAGDLVLVQQAGLGGPYATVDVGTLVSAGLLNGPSLGVGFQVPADAASSQVFATSNVLPLDGARYWNAYTAANGSYRYLANGVAGADGFDGVVGFDWVIAPVGEAATTVSGFDTLMRLSPAGALSLPHSTLTVARDPGSAMEVATMQWVGNQTVASLNGRRGVVTLDACDIGMALGYPTECIATLPQVDAAICQAIQDLIHTYPAVWSFNGRVGDVWLNVADINWALANASIPPIGPNPPPASDDGSLATTEWVRETIAAVLAGPPAYATQDWVNAQIAAIAVGVTSFNTRSGAVVLTYLDVASLGFVQQNSPSLAGIPTAPTAVAGNSTSQIATTAFVMNAITAATTGVISWNGRTGAVVLDLADVTSVGGAPVNSPNLTGVPAAPTAVQGTSSSQIATTAFVMNELAASTAGVATFNGRAGNVTLLTADITAAGGAPAASPALTGVPTAPTAANGTNTQQLATTAFVMNEIAAISAGVTTWNGRSGAVTLTANDITAAGGLANPSPQLTGTGSTFPTSVTPAANDNSTNIATTAFVQAAIANIGGSYLPLAGGANMTGLFNLAGNATANLNPVPLQQLTASLANYAPLASPGLTGTPTAPTATTATSTQQLATTAFVHAAIAAGGFATTAQLAGYLPLTGGILSGGLTLSAGNLLVSSGNITTQGANAGFLFQDRGNTANNWQWTSNANLAGLLLNTGAYAFYADTSLNTYIAQSLNIGSITTIAQNSTALVVQSNTQSVINTFCGGTVSGTACLIARTDSVNVLFSLFRSGPSTTVGSIANTGSGTTFNTTSDDRLKTNQAIVDTTVSGPLIDALSPITFNWTADPAGTAPSYGFSAQAVEAVFPQAVTAGAGNPGDEGFIPYGMDMSKLVPLLAAEVKALRARVAALEAKAA